MTAAQIKRERDRLQRIHERGIVVLMRRIFVVQFDELVGRINNMQRAPLTVDIDELFNDWDKWDSYIKKKLSPNVSLAIKEGFEFAKKQARLTGNISVNDEVFRKALLDSLSKSKYINDTTRNQVEASITEMIRNGGTVTELTTYLQTKVLPSISNYRAKSIATTTTTTATNAGSNAMMEKFKDDVSEKQWFSQKDDKVRENFEYDHVAADGLRVKIDESFEVSGESLRYPGDPRGSTGNIINCRCFIIPIKK